MNRKLLLPVFLSLTTTAFGQPLPVSSSTEWWTYLADYDGKPGSTLVDMGIIRVAPVADFPIVVIFGVKYEANPESGLPTKATIDSLNSYSDDLIRSVLAIQRGAYVGTFTHAGEQLHYVYVKSAERIEDSFRKTVAARCAHCIPVFRSKPDPQWNAYLKFLYPNQATIDHSKVNGVLERHRR